MAKINLHKISTLPPKGLFKDYIQEKTASAIRLINEYQNLMYAEHKHAILIILQGLDASGKDGAIRNVFSHLNPQGVMVKSFKQPTAEELDHDFLWRIHQHAPAKGMIQLFNRSHYEDVLITRVHNMISDKTAKKRMEAINHFENLLTTHSHTHILKFYLHISEAEQMKRIHERMNNVTKMWKYSDSDIQEAKKRNLYYKYYHEVFEKCNHIPWTIVPADKNWYKEYIIATTLLKLYKKLKMSFPSIK